MILPGKHLKVERSLLASGGALLAQLREPQTVSRLWTVARDNTELRSFDEFCLALSFLFSIDAVALSGNLVKRSND